MAGFVSGRSTSWGATAITRTTISHPVERGSFECLESERVLRKGEGSLVCDWFTRKRLECDAEEHFGELVGDEYR